MAMNPVIAVAPSITFRPEPATRSALTRLANVQELSLGALLDKFICRIDEATQAKISGGGEVLLVDNPEAPRIPVPPAPDREPLSEDEIRGPTNSTWAALEEVSSAQLMRHSHTGGKRGGNER